MECVFILGTLGSGVFPITDDPTSSTATPATQNIDNLLTQQTKLVGPSHPLPQSWGQQNADEVSKLPMQNKTTSTLAAPCLHTTAAG